MVAPFSITTPGLTVYWFIIIVMALIPIGGMILRAKGVENATTDLMLWVGFLGMGLFSLAFLIYFIRDIGWFTGFTSAKIYSAISSDSKNSDLVDPGRRQFLLYSMNWGIIGFTSLLATVGLVQARKRASVINQSISIRNLPEKLQGLRIAQISDLHVGPTIKADYAQMVVDQVNKLNPDLIFFTGDMVDGSVAHLSEDVEPLRKLKARYGKFFVTGNHEYYSGVQQWVAKVEQLGMVNLHNEHRIIDIQGASLAIAGVTDLMAGRMLKSHASDPRKATKGIPENIPTILLAHQPGTAEHTDGLSIDLMVCGHTHGGQYMPFNMAVSKIHRYAAGYYKRGGMQIYVNRGTGYWGPPLRLGIPTEITLFELSNQTESTA